MSLKEQLAAIKAKSNPPAAAKEIMLRTRADLAASGLAGQTPKIGEPAPEVTLPNIYGDIVSSAKLLSHGPLVLHFYRGGW